MATDFLAADLFQGWPSRCAVLTALRALLLRAFAESLTYRQNDSPGCSEEACFLDLHMLPLTR
jgi:hypothetical protein